MAHTPQQIERAKRILAELRATDGLSAAEVTLRAAKAADLEQRYGLGVSEAPREPENQAKSGKKRRRGAKNGPNSPNPAPEELPRESLGDLVPYKGVLKCKPPAMPGVEWSPAMTPLVRGYRTPAERAVPRLPWRQRLRLFRASALPWVAGQARGIRAAWAAAGAALASKREEDERG